MSAADRLIRATEVLAATGVPDEASLRRLVVRGQFPRPYGRLRWWASEVDGWVEEHGRFEPSMLPTFRGATWMAVYGRDRLARRARQRRFHERRELARAE